jgi:hypothetical protein
MDFTLLKRGVKSKHKLPKNWNQLSLKKYVKIIKSLEDKKEKKEKKESNQIGLS